MKPIQLTLSLLTVAIIALFLKEPISQDPVYHGFADKRTILGIPNFWNVVSNLPFFFIGVLGLKDAFQLLSQRNSFEKKWLPIVLSLGIFATSLGSAYYHWSPDNHTLVWDRLPMTLMFMALFALVMYDFCGEKVGKWSFYIALFTGVFSVFYWQYTESFGKGDLRLYALVQFFPLIILPFLFGFYPKTVNYGRLVLMTAVFYILAKLCEHFDYQVFNATAEIWSGHTVKHLLAGVALYYVVKLMKDWNV